MVTCVTLCNCKIKFFQGKEDLLLAEPRIEPVSFSTSASSGDPSWRVGMEELNIIDGNKDSERSSKCDKEQSKPLKNTSDCEKNKCDDINNINPDSDTEISNCSGSQNTTINGKVSNLHSRQSSDSFYTPSSSVSNNSQKGNKTSNLIIEELGNCRQGNIVGIHRKMVNRKILKKQINK